MYFNPKLIQLSKLIKSPISNLSGEKIGEINDVALYDRNGVTAYVVVELYNQLSGRSNELFAVPWEVISFSETEDAMLLAVDDKLLMNAPSFMKEDWVNANQKQLIVAIYEHYELHKSLENHAKLYDGSSNKGLGNSGEASTFEEGMFGKTSIERAGIKGRHKSFMNQ